MPRKSLKQKLKSQLRKEANLRAIDHEQAGITINFELQAMQSVALAHGVMSTLLAVKAQLGEEDEKFLVIQEQAQARIAQCVVQLIGMGIPFEVANQRILQGH